MAPASALGKIEQVTGINDEPYICEKMNKIGRNDPCPCASGKKYKHCCQLRQQGQTSPHRGSSGFSAYSGSGPDLAQSYFARAVTLQSQGQLEEAIRNYRDGLQLRPEYPEMLNNLGSVLDSLGRLDEAIDVYRKSLAIRPSSAEVHNNLALTLQSQGSHDAALNHYRQALSIRPDFVPAHFNLGRLLQIRGEHEAAIKCYQQVLALQPNNAQASSNLGGAYESMGELEASVRAYQRAIELDPSLVAAQNGLSGVLIRLVPLWHVSMMNDAARNDAYYSALRTAIKPESRVFEIGTGSGLLAMMAAKLGAADVTTCEAEPLVAETAGRIIKANGLASKINLVPKKSTNIELGADLKQPADILVSEIFSSELLGERVLPSIEDTKRRLLAPNCQVIPAAASIMIGLFAGEDIGSNLMVGEVCGFDLKEFNAIIPRRQTIARNDLAIEMLSENIRAFTFDFQGDSAWPPETKVLRIPVTASGRCLGIVQWMHLQMDQQTEFENHPSVVAPASSWTRCAYLLPLPVDVRPGQTAIVSAVHDRIFPWFTIIGFE